MNTSFENFKKSYNYQIKKNELKEETLILQKENINDNYSKEQSIKEEIRQLACQLNKEKDTKLKDYENKKRESLEKSKFCTNENLPFHKFSGVVSNYHLLKKNNVWITRTCI